MSTKLNTESIIDGSIEKIKLAESVQKSLNKADNAIQLTDVKTLELSDKNIKRLDVANGTIENYLTALDEATSPLHSANRLQFINPNGMIVEYSTDGGSTWVDYEMSDENKILLTSGKGATLSAGKGLSETASSSDLLRITLNAADLQVYTSAKLLLINFSTNGSNNCILDIETAYRGTETNFSIWKQGLVMKGWSGWNRIPLNMIFGGGSTQTSQIGAIRLTFSSSGATSGTGQHFKVLDLQLFGSSYWTTPSTMAKTGHLYDYNSSQTMILPQSLWPKTNGVGDIGASNYYWNNVYSNNFIKKNSSNDYVLLGGGSHKKLSDIKNEINHLVGKGAQNNALLRDLTSNPQETTLYTGGWNTGSLTGKTYATDYGTTLDISYSTWYQRLGFNTSKGNSDKPRIEYFQGINTSDGSLTKIGDLAYLSDVTDYIVLDCLYVDDIANIANGYTLTLDIAKTKSLIDSILTGKKIYIKKNNTANYIYPISYTNPGNYYTDFYYGYITFIANNVEYNLKCQQHPSPDPNGHRSIIIISKTAMLTNIDKSVSLNNLSEEVQTSLTNANSAVRFTTGGGNTNPGYDGEKQFYIQKVDGVPTLKIEMLTKSDVLSGKYTGNNGNSPFVGADIVWDLYNDVYDLADSKEDKFTYILEISLGELILTSKCTCDNAGLVNAINNRNLILVKDGLVNGVPVIKATFDSTTKIITFSYFGDSNKFYKFSYKYDPDNNINTNTIPYSSISTGIDKGMISIDLVNELKPYVTDFTIFDLERCSDYFAPVSISTDIASLYNAITQKQVIHVRNESGDSKGYNILTNCNIVEESTNVYIIDCEIPTATGSWKLYGLRYDKTNESQPCTLTSSTVKFYPSTPYVLDFTTEDLFNLWISDIDVIEYDSYKLAKSIIDGRNIIFNDTVTGSNTMCSVGGTVLNNTILLSLYTSGYIYILSNLSIEPSIDETGHIIPTTITRDNMRVITLHGVYNQTQHIKTLSSGIRQIVGSDSLVYALPGTANGDEDVTLLGNTTVKTINNTSIYKSSSTDTNIYTYYPTSSVTVVGTADRAASYMLSPNILYNWGDYIPINISILLGRPYENVVNEYVLQFKTTNTVPTVVFPSSVKWVSGNAPVLEENKIYQISIINNLGTVLSWDNA